MEFVGQVIGAGRGADPGSAAGSWAPGPGATGAHAEQVVGPVDMAFEVPDRAGRRRGGGVLLPVPPGPPGPARAGPVAGRRDSAGARGGRGCRLGGRAAGRGRGRPGDRHGRGPREARMARDLGADIGNRLSGRAASRRRCSRPPKAGASTCASTGSEAGDHRVLALLGPQRPAPGRRLRRRHRSRGGSHRQRPHLVLWQLLFGGCGPGLLGPRLAAARFGIQPTPPHIGDEVQAHLVELLAAGRIRPVVGGVVPFEQLPEALEEMEARTTMGRIVVRIKE